ncbi:cation-translocating P-type ATPase [Roseibium aggregatum]|uniref:Cation-transporting P-type ATPase n=1 Tax=Roseibium aggregatum TaxID=187304 RepID=A0A939EB01_9HYPH|nr:cation-transporting P-type ATPase [Roseibium aggregatum]MBN9669307.1 cation-transporting P-type ATPase [Roseibium aggregatum]
MKSLAPIPSPEKPFASEAGEVAEALAVAPSSGLSAGEVSRRRKVHGPNRLRQQKPRSALAILGHQFASLIVWLLGGAVVLSLALGDIADAIAITAVLLLNGAIGFFTELRAARSMEALLRITEVRVRVRRDSRVREVDAHQLVPGDIVVLEAGDIVCADLRLVTASNLWCDESLLTGESAPVTKQSDALAADRPLAERANMAFSGTAVTQGLGEGIVVATGMATELGHISALTQAADSEASPLEKRLDRLGHKLVWLTAALAVLTSVTGILWGHSIPVMLKTGVALAVAAIPEGLPVVATLCLARGMWRMAARNALVTQLSAVETLGATTLILTDKTGTLTENRMTVVGYLLPEKDVEVLYDGDEIRFEANGEALVPEGTDSLARALKTGVLCNSAEIGDGGDGEKTGEPMEIALLSVAAKAGLSKADLLDKLTPLRQHAFDPDRKMMATVHRDDGHCLYAVKGAPEAVLETSQKLLGRDGAREMTDEDRAALQARSESAAGSGLRLLALAYKSAQTDTEDPYEGLTLVALVCFLDPLREDVPAAIEASQNAGVRVVMMTGDHANTAEKIAEDAGFGSGALKVIAGREIAGFDPDSLSPEQRAKMLATDIFARVAPETKLKLVSLFQDDGHVVAMTGDGVNDAPALKKADIGIAMGQRGTQVAREASDVVLKDDDFATIIAAMKQGRIIFDNIRKFVVYLLSCNVSEVLIVGVAVGIGLPVPLLPLQILFLNLVTDVFPAFALGLGRGDDEVMRQPPRDPDEPIIDTWRWSLIGLLGGAITLSTLAAFSLALFHYDLGTEASVTVAFLTLALAQLWNVFNVRAPSKSLLASDIFRNGWVWAALALCLFLLALALRQPELAALLGLPWPGVNGLALAGAMSLVPLVLGQIVLKLSPAARRVPTRGKSAAATSTPASGPEPDRGEARS